MHKKSEIALQTRRNIMDAFWSLYCETRIEKITVKAIVVKAGYNRSTFYEYFLDIYDVLEQVEKSLIPTFEELPPITIGAQVHGMPMDVFFELYEKNSAYYAVLLGDKGDPAFASKLKHAIKPIIFQELRQLSGVNRVELDYALEYTLSAMIGIMSYWFEQEKKLDTVAMHDLIRKLTEEGVKKLFV